MNPRASRIKFVEFPLAQPLVNIIYYARFHMTDLLHGTPPLHRIARFGTTRSNSFMLMLKPHHAWVTWLPNRKPIWRNCRKGSSNTASRIELLAPTVKKFQTSAVQFGIKPDFLLSLVGNRIDSAVYPAEPTVMVVREDTGSPVSGSEITQFSR